MTPNSDTYLMLRLTKAWRDDISDEDLFEATRAWWIMSMAKAERVTKVFAVAHGVVRAVYTPDTWLYCTEPGEEHRVGFEGGPADDSGEWVGVDLGALFKKGSANPVLYVDPPGFLAAYQSGDRAVDDRPVQPAELGADEPGLEESITPLLRELDGDLLWSMSRAGQELFHSNTLSFLMTKHPGGMLPVRRLFEGGGASGPLQTWRELRNLDIVGESDAGRFVVENKLYSLPYPEQLTRYLEKDLPWSTGHGPTGAPDTDYVLLTLMDPAFTLPTRWRQVGYDALAEALAEIPRGELGDDADLAVRYTSLVRRLVDLTSIVDPRTNLDEPFLVNDLLSRLQLAWFGGPLQRIRFTGLAQTIAAGYGQPRDFEVGLTNTRGLLTYLRPLSKHRSIGWQLQDDALRLVVLFGEPHLFGKGDAKKQVRAEAAQQSWLSWFDFTVVEEILGPLLTSKGTKPGAWNHYDPDFLYRSRRIAPETTTRQLAQALVALTERTDEWSVQD